jgi:hypothetical protein
MVSKRRRARRTGGRLATIAAAALSLFALLAVPAAAQSVGLAWDPSPDQRVRGYVVFVGASPNDPFSAFDVGTTTRFDFSTRSSGGRLYFSVSSYGADRVLGPRSSEVSTAVTVVNTGHGSPIPPTDSGRIADRPFDASEATPSPVCFDDGRCYTSTILLESAAVITSLAADPLGHLYFIEGQQRVRRMPVSGGPGDIVLAAGDSGRRILSLALDPAFARSGRVFTAESAPGRDGTTAFDIVRYRTVSDRWGERAVVAAALPGGTIAPVVTLDGESHIFAVLGATPRQRSSAGGLILRFDTDGVPRGQTAASPIVARGPEVPADAIADAPNGTLLVSGSNAGVATTIMRVPTGAASSSGSVPTETVLLAPGGRVIRARRQADTSYQLVTAIIPNAVAAAATPDGRIYVAVLQSGGLTDVLRLEPADDGPR